MCKRHNSKEIYKCHISTFGLQGKRKTRPHFPEMVVQINVEGFEAYKKATESISGKSVFALFTGSVGEDGKSWCPDCSKADPVIERSIPKLPEDAVFIKCEVGDRAFWKNQSNIFRTDTALKLTSVPTLIKLGGPQRLQEEQCAQENLVEMLFTDE